MRKIFPAILSLVFLFPPIAFPKTVEELESEIQSIQGTLQEFQYRMNQFESKLREYELKISDYEFQTGAPEERASDLR